MGLTHQCFLFVKCVIEFNLTIGEGIFYKPFFITLVQSWNCKINYVKNSGFHNKKYNEENAQAIENKHQQIIGQAH